jgi:neural Wiskott-Aldrich syndrome protein
MPPLHEPGQPGQEGSTPHGNAQPPILPYYIHPGSYPYPHYAHPGAAYPPHGGPPPPSHTLEPAEPAKKPEEAGTAAPGTDDRAALVAAKGSTRGVNGSEPKAKKTKKKITGNRWQKGAKAQGEAAHQPDQEFPEPVTASA